MDFSEEQLHRYARHLVLPEIGGKGQRRLLDSRVFVVGAGGLGSPALLYLAAAGVGTLEIADPDEVDLSNLQRQVLHRTAGIGQLKVDSAREALQALNPDVRVVTHPVRVDATNTRDLLAGADVVLDGSDNFATRYLLNDICHALGKPLVSGALFRHEGQVTVFPMRGDETPCYRCLYPEAPPRGVVPTCAESGILGMVAGVIGALQAAETVKLLLGIGDPLVGRLLLYNALEARFEEVRVRRNPGCALKRGQEPFYSTDPSNK